MAHQLFQKHAQDWYLLPVHPYKSYHLYEAMNKASSIIGSTNFILDLKNASSITARLTSECVFQARPIYFLQRKGFFLNFSFCSVSSLFCTDCADKQKWVRKSGLFSMHLLWRKVHFSSLIFKISSFVSSNRYFLSKLRKNPLHCKKIMYLPWFWIWCMMSS